MTDDVDGDASQGSSTGELLVRVPIADFLGGLMIHSFEALARHDFAFVLAKVEDDQGGGWSYRTTSYLGEEQLAGILAVHVRLLLDEMLSEWDEEFSEESLEDEHSDGERVEISNELEGLSLFPIEGRVSFVFLLVRTMGVDGEPPHWSYRTTSPPNREELLGALMVQQARYLSLALQQWE